MVFIQTRVYPHLVRILACLWNVPTAGGSALFSELVGKPEESSGYRSLLGDRSCQEERHLPSSFGGQRRGVTLSMEGG